MLSLEFFEVALRVRNYGVALAKFLVAEARVVELNVGSCGYLVVVLHRI